MILTVHMHVACMRMIYAVSLLVLTLSFGAVMSADMTWHMMKTCVDLGARFLVKKPLDATTVNNLWQHLDLKFARMEKIKDLFQGIS